MLASSAPGSVLFNDSFQYPDGPVTQAVGSPWATLSGTAHQVEILQGALMLTDKESEDVSASLGNSSFSSGALYIGFTVQFSALPNGDGGFFFHLKDTGTGQRARVYATTQGASAGSFRLGIANGSANASFVDADLHLGTRYLVVARYDISNPVQTTLWINPTTESDALGLITASDSVKFAPITGTVFRQSLTAGNGMGSLRVDYLKVGTEFQDVGGANTPPTISRIPDQSIAANQSTGPLEFTIEDLETPADDLHLSVDSSNPALVSVKGVAFKGDGNTRYIELLPNPGAQGISQISVFVSDGDKTSSTVFQVVVGAPSITGPHRVEIPQNGTRSNLQFDVLDREIFPEALSVSVQSSDPLMLPPTAFQWTGSGSQRTLEITPTLQKYGIAMVDVIVSDGTLTATNGLMVLVFPDFGTVFSDDFNRPNGPLITANSSWGLAEGTGPSPEHLSILDQALQLSETRAEDAQAALRNSPYKTNSGALCYVALTLHCTKLPSSSGGLLGEFGNTNKDSAGRLFVLRKGASAGHYHFGIASGFGTTTNLTNNVALNESVTLVMKWNVSLGETTLWMNPESEVDPSVVSVDPKSPIEVTHWFFRQTAGMGEWSVDQIQIASRFSEALHPTNGLRLEISKVAKGVQLAWDPDDAVQLEQSVTLAKPSWKSVTRKSTDANGKRTVVVPTDKASGYFRLKK